MAHPFRNTGKCGTSPVTQAEGEEIVDWEGNNNMSMGSPQLGAFTIPIAAARYLSSSTGPRDPFDQPGKHKPTTQEFKNMIKSYKIPDEKKKTQ